MRTRLGRREADAQCRPSASELPERRALVHRDVIGLVALDLVLRLVLAGMDRVALNVILVVTTRVIRPRTRPASEFQLTWSPRLNRFVAIGFLS
jgi:hypothetical protein